MKSDKNKDHLSGFEFSQMPNTTVEYEEVFEARSLVNFN